MTALATAWPFLVARGRRRGYRTLLAPEFLVGPRLHGLLADAPERSGDGPRAVEVDGAQLGSLTLVYDTEIVTSHDIGGVALDQHGRDLQIRYGVVLRGSAGGAAELPRGVRERALESYRTFLADEDRFDVELSDPLGVRSMESTPGRDPGPRLRTILICVAGVVIAVVIAAVLLNAHGPVQPDYLRYSEAYRTYPGR